MFHFFDAIQNKNGDALVGYYGQVTDSFGNVVPIYSDDLGTPIINASGIADMAKVDANGNLSLYVEPGTYTLTIFGPDATTIALAPIPDVPMDRGPKGDKGDAGERPIYATWAALSAVTGTAGGSAEVPDSDTGTHADPVTAATVANGGIYSWSSSPAGWQRVADTDALSAKPYADAAAASASDAAALAASLATSIPINTATAVAKIYEKGTVFVAGTSGFTLNASGQYQRTGSAADRVIEQFGLGAELLAERAAGRPITIKSDVISGSWNASQPTIKQYDASGVQLGAAAVMTVANGVASATITIDPAATQFRFDGTASQAVAASRPYILKQGQTLIDETTEAWTVLKERWSREVATTNGNQFGVYSAPAAVVGSACTFHRDGRTVTLPSGSVATANVRCKGILTAGTEYTVILEKVSGAAPEASQIYAQPDHGDGSGFGAASDRRFVRGNYHFVQGLSDAASGRSPAYLTIRIDNRAPGGSVYTAATISYRIVGVLYGRVHPSKLIDIAGWLKHQAVREREVATVGADLPAIYANAYTTIEDALRAGHRRIEVASDVRLTAGLGRARGAEIVGIVDQNGGTRPIIYGSTKLVPGDWTATANPQVYFHALAYNPLDIWSYDTSAGTITRLGEPENNVTIGKVKMSASEAAVAGAAGNYWYGAGSLGTGLYIRPLGDTLTGKTWEVANQYCDSVLHISGGEWLLENIGLRHSLSSHALFQRSGRLTTKNCEIGRSAGAANGIQLELGAVYEDFASYFVDAGNDNIGWNSDTSNPVRARFHNTWSDNAQCDTLAGHGGLAVIDIVGLMRLTNAGKQGFVMIDPVMVTADAITIFGTRDIGFLHSETGSVASVYNIANLRVDGSGSPGTVKIENTVNPAIITGTIQGTWGTLTKTSSAVTALALTATVS